MSFLCACLPIPRNPGGGGVRPLLLERLVSLFTGEKLAASEGVVALPTILRDPHLRDILALLLVLQPDHHGKRGGEDTDTDTLFIPLIASILNRSPRDVQAALDDRRKLAPYVERHENTVALKTFVRDRLVENAHASLKRRKGEIVDVGYYHSVVARWCLGTRWSEYPLILLYAAERWEYHLTRSTRSAILYREIRDSSWPRRLQAYEYKWLKSTITWLWEGEREQERDLAIVELDAHLEEIARRVKGA
ncbi:hypothetical protein FB45DRAFT_999897 [Roridomyces roridus]|uniref:Uncharacterized protein n=1 Tax=Roridomyces roridus TaxID=1738132 RepID=A0AAD7C747_9AGAR|nr:hypothetical protein FB45DRAFT_999897 [Roridomyces roridus]